jgi:hypothetical protein
MAKIIWFDLGSITWVVEEALVKWIDKALSFRAPFIREISPIDTGDYIGKHKISKAKNEWWVIIGSNLNDSEHAFWVEFGFRKTPVNWSKEDKTTIYNWVWANVMQRATNDQTIRNQVLGIIVKQLAGW